MQITSHRVILTRYEQTTFLFFLHDLNQVSMCLKGLYDRVIVSNSERSLVSTDKAGEPTTQRWYRLVQTCSLKSPSLDERVIAVSAANIKN